MATSLLSPNAKQQFFDNAGQPAAGFKLYTYAANTLTPQATYSNRAGTVANTNPIILDARGEAVIYLPPGVVYDYVLTSPADVPVWTREDIEADALATDLSSGDSGKGASLVAFRQTTTTPVRTVQDRLLDTVSLLDFIPQSEHAAIRARTSTYDGTAAWQAALDYVASRNGACLDVPAGLYLVTDGLVYNGHGLHLRGAGEGSTAIYTTTTTGDVFSIGDGTANPNDCSIRGITMGVAEQRVSGAMLRVRNAHNIRIEHIRISGGAHFGIQLDGGPQQFLYYLDHFEISAAVVGIIIGEVATLPQDIWISRGCIAHTSSDAILLKGASGVFIREIDTIECAHGLSTYPGVGQAVQAIWIHALLCDTSTSNGLQLATNGGEVTEVTITSLWASNCAGNGVNIGGNVRGVSLTAPRVIINQKHGIAISGGEDITISNPQVLSNSQEGSNLYDGISIGAGVSGWSIVGGVCGAGGILITNYQRAGIRVAAGASDRYIITGVNLDGNVSAGLIDLGTGAYKCITANMGHNQTFTAPTLLNSWVNNGGTYDTAGYFKDADGFVHLKGSIKSGVIPSAVFSLPAGYTPALDKIFSTISGAGASVQASIAVKSGGQVEILSGDNAYLTLDGIKFQAL